MRSFLRRNGPLVKWSFGKKFGLGKTRQTAAHGPADPVNVPDLRALMEKVCQAETHLQSLQNHNPQRDVDDRLRSDETAKEKAPV